MTGIKRITVRNVTTEAVAYTEEGHCVYPHEWASVPLNSQVLAALDKGQLVRVEHTTLTKSANPDALRAARMTDAANAAQAAGTDTMSAANTAVVAKKATKDQ